MRNPKVSLPSARTIRALLLVLPLGLVAACGGSDSGSAGEVSSTTVAESTTESPVAEDTTTSAGQDTTVEPATTVEEEATTTLPAGAQAGLDDFDGDGEMDPTCGTQDFGAGLVLRIPCEINTASEVPTGAVLVERSLFRLPSSTDVNLDGISGSLLFSRDVAGAKVAMFVFNSDGLFATGSDAINSTGTLDNTIRLINAMYAGSTIQVRGHTDARGTAAANQALSERRATRVQQYLTDHGTKAARITSVGLSSTAPLALETNPDGKANEEGQHFNRRVELILRVP